MPDSREMLVVAEVPAAVSAPSPPSALASRLAVIVGSHAVVDVYSAYVPPLLSVLEVRCKLTPTQTSWVIGIGALTSGLSQPISAWLSDRIDSRIFAAAGLALAAVCLSYIGAADSFASLLPLFVLGMIGSGVFHPTAAASMGQLADQLPGERRSMGISLFYVAGMLGGFVTSLAVPRFVAMPNGFSLLRYGLIPGVICAVVLHAAIRSLPHRHHAHHVRKLDQGELQQRWAMIGLLYFANVLRFMVNTVLMYLFLRWVGQVVRSSSIGMDSEAIAESVSKVVGNLTAMMIVGMAVGGISASWWIRKGCEKWPMILLPILCAPAIALFPKVGIQSGYALAVISGIGFAAMVPVSVGLAQRLLPHRTTLASGLMLGGAWGLAFISPRGAEYCLSTLGWSLDATFAFTAALLAISGLVCLPLRADVLRRTATRN